MTDIQPLSEHEERGNRGVIDVGPTARFIEQMGLICESDNLPRIAGRVLGLLIVEDGAFSLRELADRLQVSRASVSTNARMLTDIGAVERVAKPGDRQDYYQLARDPFRRLLEGKVRGLRQAAFVFADAAESFPPDRANAKRRLLEMAAFHRDAADTVTELIERSATKRH
jgi:DNA-binding transcriptional regulator GbsR (MarR family)